MSAPHLKLNATVELKHVPDNLIDLDDTDNDICIKPSTRDDDKHEGQVEEHLVIYQTNQTRLPSIITICTGLYLA